MARTAVIAGTATTVSEGVQRSPRARHEAAANAAASPSAAPVAAPAASPAGGDLLSQLQKLADLKAARILDDTEFSAAKAKLLAT